VASNPYPDLKRGTWSMKYRPDPTGKWRRVTLGKDPRLKGARPPKVPPQFVIDRARDFAEVEYRAKHGMTAGPARAKPLADYLESYLEAARATLKPGSARQLARHVRRFGEFAAAAGIANVQAVTRTLCRQYLEWRIEQVAHDTLRTEKNYLAPIWARAVEDGLMVASPWAGLKVPGKSTRSKPVFWSGEEIAAIARCCARPWQSDFVLVLANTGMRISSALAMEWSWVDFAKGTITVPRAHSKGGRPMVLAMSRGARGVLERRQMTAGRSRLVFPNPLGDGGIVPYDTAREAIARAIVKAGVKPGTPHDCRHSYARALALAGVPMAVIQALLGHASLSTTQIYTDMSESEAAKFVGDFEHGSGE
jgi:integrase/recombinase XerD